MKFRALMIDTLPMKEFANIVITISKLSKECILRITSDKLYFIITDEENGPNKPSVWCELPVKYYFREFNMEGLSPAHNEIYLDFSPVLLAKSLTTLRQSAASIKMKLTNKAAPCLTIEIQLPSETQYQQCTHDIMVKILQRKFWIEYQKPDEADYHVTIDMPNLKSVKTIIDRLRVISPNLTLSASQSGRLVFSIKTSMGEMSAHFRDLDVKSFSGHTLADTGSDEIVSARIDIKNFSKFLTSQQINYSKVTCNIVEGSLVKLFLEHPEAVKLEYYLTEKSK